MQLISEALISKLNPSSCAVVFLFGMGISLPAHALIWDEYSNPNIIDSTFEYNLNKLPLSGTLSTKPWSGSYWAANKGSINIRWNAPGAPGSNYHLNSLEELKTMSRAQLLQLSPSEKYDVYMGRYDYPLHGEVTGWTYPAAQDWVGICDGWSVAATQYKEPNITDAVNPDGIIVPFGTSDLDGLMSFAAAAHFESQTRQVGLQCERIDQCDNINVGSLHVILANEIGLKHEAIITQRVHTLEIWNQPTFGFNFELRGSAQSADGDHGVLVHGTLIYTDELNFPSYLPVTHTDQFAEGTIEMDYILDLDANENIIGGSYLKGSDYPGFVWKEMNQLTFNNYMDGINHLYQPVLKKINKL
jgi:hypothetical protein